MQLQRNEKTGKNILHINVYPSPVLKDGVTVQGYKAVCREVPMCWSEGASIDDCIGKFKKEYGGLLQMQFADGGLEFDFAVKLQIS